MSVPEVDVVAEELIGHYRRSWDRVLSELERLSPVPAGQERRVRRLREVARGIAAEMRDLARLTGGRVEGAVDVTYRMGYGHGTIAAGATAVDWTLMDYGPARIFADGLTDRLLAATDGVDRSTKRLLRQLVRDEGLHKLIAGDTAVAVGGRVTREAGVRGIHAVRYADGSLHGLAEYAQMAVRTTTGFAYNGAEIAGAASEGCKWWEVFDGPDCGLVSHDDPQGANGMIVERATADAYPLAHPNCRRSFGPRPDIESAKQARETPGSVTAEQVEAQRAADAERRAILERHARTRDRVARRNRSSRDRRGYRANR